MIAQESFTKAREQADQFAQVLSLTYDIPVKITLRICKDEENENKIQTLLKTVADYFEVPLHALTAKGRKREIVEARQIAATLIYRTFKLEPTLKKTGLWFSGQDHSTIIHAMDTVDDLCFTNKLFAFNFRSVSEIIESKIGTP